MKEHIPSSPPLLYLPLLPERHHRGKKAKEHIFLQLHRAHLTLTGKTGMFSKVKPSVCTSPRAARLHVTAIIWSGGDWTRPGFPHKPLEGGILRCSKLRVVTYRGKSWEKLGQETGITAEIRHLCSALNGVNASKCAHRGFSHHSRDKSAQING